MSQYLDEPELTSETVVDGWLMTGDLGRLDSTGHLQLFGRKKNMIVTEEGKNIYPEDIEAVFEGIAVKEFCVFAANYIWPKRTMIGEQLVMVVHLEPGQNFEGVCDEINARNRGLLSYKRISGVIVRDRDFPRTASLKIKRNMLAEELANLDRSTSVIPL
jgi:long-chain acyl-CoA synthetase